MCQYRRMECTRQTLCFDNQLISRSPSLSFSLFLLSLSLMARKEIKSEKYFIVGCRRKNVLSWFDTSLSICISNITITSVNKLKTLFACGWKFFFFAITNFDLTHKSTWRKRYAQNNQVYSMGDFEKLSKIYAKKNIFSKIQSRSNYQKKRWKNVTFTNKPVERSDRTISSVAMASDL